MATRKKAETTRKRADWDAVERDYRTGRFTFRELETMHGMGFAQICRKAKEKGWQKDLSDVIRQATNAALLRETATTAQQTATEAVLAAAEANKQVILGHRARILELVNVADAARRKVAEEGAKVKDIRSAAVFAQALAHLATTTKQLIEEERKAFQLDSEKPPQNPGSGPTVVLDFETVRQRAEQVAL